MGNSKEQSIIEERIKTEFLMHYNGTKRHFSLDDYKDMLSKNGFEIIYSFDALDDPLFIIKYKGDDLDNIAEYIANVEAQSDNMLKIYSNLEKKALEVEK